MANEETSENDKKIADSETTPEGIETPATADKSTKADTPTGEVLDIEASELDQALEELIQLSPEAAKTPRIKDLLQSPDAPSRFMTILSIVFGILALTAFSLLITLYLKHRALQKKVVPVAETVVVADIINEPLGEFKLVLNSDGDKSQQRELRVDVVAECSTHEACDYIKDHLPEARDVVIPVLSTATQEELLSADSKNLIRRRIAERLNSIPMSGKVLQIHFTDLTIE